MYDGRVLGRLLLLALPALVLGACEKPDSIELGQPCTSNAQCKEPADTCLTIHGKARCSMACDKQNRCPEGYACPVTDPAHKDRGMCLPQGALGSQVVTVY